LKNIKKRTSLNAPHFRGEKCRSFGASRLKRSFTNTYCMECHAAA